MTRTEAINLAVRRSRVLEGDLADRPVEESEFHDPNDCCYCKEAYERIRAEFRRICETNAVV
jgi:hypothetical protein